MRLKKHMHPLMEQIIYCETKDGWDMLGQTLLYGYLKTPGGSRNVHTNVAG
jgi:hypothetical protein